MYYIIDLERAKLDIKTLTNEDIKSDMEFFGVDSPEQLNDFDWKVFSTLKAARAWLAKYQSHKRGLKKLKSAKDLPKACLTLKRRYLVQTSMNEKLFTIRGYEKKWKSGQLFYFHDQTYYILVKLKNIVQLTPNEFRYDFELE